MFEHARARLAEWIEILGIPDRVERMDHDMSELRDAYNLMAGATEGAVLELTRLAQRVAELNTTTAPGEPDPEAASVASDMRSLANALTRAYQPPVSVPSPTTDDPDVVDPGDDQTPTGEDATPTPAPGLPAPSDDGLPQPTDEDVTDTVQPPRDGATAPTDTAATDAGATTDTGAVNPAGGDVAANSPGEGLTPTGDLADTPGTTTEADTTSADSGTADTAAPEDPSAPGFSGSTG